MNPDDLPSLEELAALLPQYRFESLIAEGGMGAVYRAEQVSLGRPVAIKILPRSFTADATYREQFQAEARLMGSLNYPHIVNIHDFGRAGDVLYIVMELLEGTTLLHRMNGEPLKQQDIVKILSQACDALTAAHHKGVVHRDVKPENIFIEPGLRVKLGDFGIARQRRPEAEPSSATQASISGLRLGTPEYAAPELFDFSRHIDHRADIFSLGVVLYELLTGARPTGTFIAPSRRKAGVDRRFDDVVMRAMQQQPADRYANAEEMKKDLLRILSPAAQPAVRPAAAAGVPTGQRGARPLPPPAPPSRQAPGRKSGPGKRSAVLLGSVGAAAALVAVLIIVFKGGGKTKPAPQTPETAQQLEKIFSGSETGNTPQPAPPRPPDPPAPAPPAPLPPSSPSAPELVFGESVYQFIPSRFPWRRAKREAETQGGHLAVITSEAEYEALREYLLPLLKESNDMCWLGASDEETEGTWKWVTGEPFQFFKWAPDAPNDGSSSEGAQDFLAWHFQSKYGERRIEWNDLRGGDADSANSGYLLEKPKPGAAPPPETTEHTAPSPPDKDKPSAPGPAAGSWQAVHLTKSELTKHGDRLTPQDGWYVAAGAQSCDLPESAAFSDGAVRVRLRADEDARLFQIRPRFGGSDTLICGLHGPSTVRIVRRESGEGEPLAEWRLAAPVARGDEILLEIRLLGPQLTVLLNGVTIGSVDTGMVASGRNVRLHTNFVSFRDVEWIALDGVSDPDKAMASPSAWPAPGDLAAALAEFARLRDAAYGSKLHSGMVNLRDSYAKRLRLLAGQKPAEAAIYTREEAFITGGGDPPPPDAPGTPAALAPLRKTWHDAKAALEKPLAAAALGVWQAHRTKLDALASAFRQAKKHADAAWVAPHLREAEAALAHFSAFAPNAAKAEAPPAGLKRPSVPGHVVVWRRGPDVNHDNGAAEVPADLGPVVAIAAGPEYALALRPDGTVVQWGTSFAKHVEPPAGLTDVVALDAGGKFSAALRSDGSIVAWGAEHRSNLVPRDLKPAVAIACGDFHGHALHADGTVSLFGWPTDSYPGSFAPPEFFKDIRALDASREITVAAKSDGTLVFIGSNEENQITGVPARRKPATMVASAASVTAAFDGDTIYFWGKGTSEDDAEYARGSFKFPAVALNAAPFASIIAARNAAGDWKVFSHRNATDIREAVRRARGAIDLRWSKEHLLALMPEDRR